MAAALAGFFAAVEARDFSGAAAALLQVPQRPGSAVPPALLDALRLFNACEAALVRLAFLRRPRARSRRERQPRTDPALPAGYDNVLLALGTDDAEAEEARGGHDDDDERDDDDDEPVAAAVAAVCRHRRHVAAILQALARMAEQPAPDAFPAIVADLDDSLAALAAAVPADGPLAAARRPVEREALVLRHALSAQAHTAAFDFAAATVALGHMRHAVSALQQPGRAPAVSRLLPPAAPATAQARVAAQVAFAASHAQPLHKWLAFLADATAAKHALVFTKPLSRIEAHVRGAREAPAALRAASNAMVHDYYAEADQFHRQSGTSARVCVALVLDSSGMRPGTFYHRHGYVCPPSLGGVGGGGGGGDGNGAPEPEPESDTDSAGSELDEDALLEVSSSDEDSSSDGSGSGSGSGSESDSDGSGSDSDSDGSGSGSGSDESGDGDGDGDDGAEEKGEQESEPAEPAQDDQDQGQDQDRDHDQEQDQDHDQDDEEEPYQVPRGLRAWPAIYVFPRQPPADHWPNIVSLLLDSPPGLDGFQATPFHHQERRVAATYFLQRVDPNITLAVIYDEKRRAADKATIEFMRSFGGKLRNVDVFRALVDPDVATGAYEALGRRVH